MQKKKKFIEEKNGKSRSLKQQKKSLKEQKMGKINHCKVKKFVIAP